MAEKPKANELEAKDAAELLEIGMKAVGSSAPQALELLKDVVMALGGKLDGLAGECLAQLSRGLERSGAWPEFEPLEFMLRFTGGVRENVGVKAGRHASAVKDMTMMGAVFLGPKGIEKGAEKARRFEAAMGVCLESRWSRFPGKAGKEIAAIVKSKHVPETFKAMAESAALERAAQPGKSTSRPKPL